MGLFGCEHPRQRKQAQSPGMKGPGMAEEWQGTPGGRECSGQWWLTRPGGNGKQEGGHICWP